MKYACDLYKKRWQDYEDLVIDVSSIVLGIGVSEFTDGPDGGRDAYFEGTAEAFPSSNASWSGRFVVQAKHTTHPVASCSNPDFEKILKEEIERLKKIEFDCYILFTNRRISGNKHVEIVERLKTELNKQNITLIGIDTLDRHLNNNHPIIKKHKLLNLGDPVKFYDHDIKRVIKTFGDSSRLIEKIQNESISDAQRMQFVEKQVKNEKNNLSEDYFEYIKDNSLIYFRQIEIFLRDPDNKDLNDSYSRTVSDLQAKILIHRENYPAFQALIEEFIDRFVENNEEEMMDYRLIVRIFFHFMYWECDIGIK